MAGTQSIKQNQVVKLEIYKDKYGSALQMEHVYLEIKRIPSMDPWNVSVGLRDQAGCVEH